MMSLQSFEVIWEVTVKQPHTIVAARKAGFWKDRLEILVDNRSLMSAAVSGFKLTGSKTIWIDGEPIEVSWKWGVLSGSPKSIVLVNRGQILAKYPQGEGFTLNTTGLDVGFTEHLASLPIDQIPLAQLKLFEAKVKSERQLRGGATWFYWIAGLSVLNSLLFWFGTNLNFLLGLAFSQFIDVVLHEVSIDLGMENNLIITGIALFLDLLIAGVFAIFGVFARKKYNWGFIVGMSLYTIDALLFLSLGSILSVAFHVLALIGLYSGIRALKQLKDLDKHGTLTFQNT
jgi:hypothetical protein